MREIKNGQTTHARSILLDWRELALGDNINCFPFCISINMLVDDNCCHFVFQLKCQLVILFSADRVLLTPLRSMVVPPPMSAFYLQMAGPIQCLAYCSSSVHSNDIAILLANNLLVIYKYLAGILIFMLHNSYIANMLAKLLFASSL